MNADFVEFLARVWRALAGFGAPVEAFGVRPADLETPDMVVQMGFHPAASTCSPG